MKRIAFTLLFILGVLITKAQDWQEIQYDKLVRFELPTGYTVQDTGNAKIFQSEIKDTTYIVTIIKDANQFRFETEESIDAFYNDYFDVLVEKASHPTVIQKDIIEFGKFRALRASLVQKIIVKELTWEILFVQVKNTTLYFQCITQKGDKAQYQRLLNSIAFDESISREDQIGHPTENSVRSAFDERIAIYGSIGVVIFILFLIYRKRKK